ncbi:protein of unknown function [Tepidanaerobacter acetatoxydans Re1]|uniref:4Fe-4S ferredoxin-type domain-containing protein n=1 Tax=Tepidanaerobacter acetatoxydans (strain DSM 21804 / JCM 16047 / Re1) TaxID=1209989 RepID=L0S772_TEPAE|nr:4Fe-4S dicluster domain-containing protein [Tepidanaerobacter acetatoxydans]CCP27667.1 protein of unknown function [Tepidanaerobacter acetatoxydans Re1]
MSKKAYKQRIYIEAEKCVECGACTAVCGAKALYLDKATWKLIYNVQKCQGCMLCVSACPSRAIKSDIEDLPSAVAAAL